MRSVKRGPTVVGEKCDDPGPRPIADWGRDTKLIAQLVAATALVAEKNVGSGRSYNLPPCPYERTSTGNFLAKLSMPPPQTASPPQQHGYSLFFSIRRSLHVIHAKSPPGAHHTSTLGMGGGDKASSDS